MRIPGLGPLILNVGGISALTALWDTLPNEAPDKYDTPNIAFFAFCAGVLAAVSSLSIQFIRSSIRLRSNRRG